VVISPDDVTTDPRLIFDPAVQRWYASMVDASQSAVDPALNANDFLFAVSAGADPTGPWHGFLFQADPDTGYFADFPTLGVDSSAVYLSGGFCHGLSNPIGPGLVSLPKADLLAATPTIANRTWFGVMDYAVRGQVLQPAICLDGSASGRILAVPDIALLESGTIADPDMDLFYPSIAANPYGVVTVAFNGCSPSTSVSCFALVGQTANGVTSFSSRLLLQSGATSYHGDDEVYAELLGNPPFSRWGDYSATSVDPSDPNRFWTIQMFPSDIANADVWSTQVTELVTAPQFMLAIMPAGTNVTVSWSSVATGYQLQSAVGLDAPATWTNVMQVVLTNGSQISVTVPASAQQQFFRLQKP
jgi:hypothetical protein